MKCTNFHKLYEEIRHKEMAELRLALKAHGGSFEFSDDNCIKYGTYPPYVDGTCNNWQTDGTFRITRVVLEGDTHIAVYGLSDEICDSEEVWLETLVRGAYYDILELIPPTDEVQDVTIMERSIPVQWVTDDDLEDVGYDPEISDADFKELAECVARKIDTADYWEALRDACEYCNIPEID